jgi:hypothetical protein
MSKSIGKYDDILPNLNPFEHKEVIITEKMDGENTTLYPDYIHARSIDSNHHESRDWIKAQHAAIKYLIPDGWRVVGENLFAQHSIPYYHLDSYFYIFAVFDNEHCLSWEEVELMSEELDFPTVPIIWRGKFNEKTLYEILRNKIDIRVQEGIVIRNAKSFHIKDFDKNIAKWVRPNHVQTDDHWISKEITKNQLKISKKT